jgi:hypothetical protein
MPDTCAFWHAPARASAGRIYTGARHRCARMSDVRVPARTVEKGKGRSTAARTGRPAAQTNISHPMRRCGEQNVHTQARRPSSPAFSARTHQCTRDRAPIPGARIASRSLDVGARPRPAIRGIRNPIDVERLRRGRAGGGRYVVVKYLPTTSTGEHGRGRGDVHASTPGDKERLRAPPTVYGVRRDRDERVIGRDTNLRHPRGSIGSGSGVVGFPHNSKAIMRAVDGCTWPRHWRARACCRSCEKLRGFKPIPFSSTTPIGYGHGLTK